MFSRPLDYTSSPYKPYNQQINQGYSSDFASFPTYSPYSFSSQPNYGYTPALQSQPIQNFHSNYRNDRNNSEPKIAVSQNKGFLDGFDNNSSSLLNQQKSYARNIKGRLFNNSDDAIEKIKQNNKQSYREQLQQQIQQTKRRKKQQKQKIQKQEMERQRKFYEEFKIQAQVKQTKEQNKGQKGYVMARTIHKFKRQKVVNNQATPKKQSEVPNSFPNIKARGKTYQNKSSLDNFDVQVAQASLSPKQRLKDSKITQHSPPRLVNRFSKFEEQIFKERSNQQQRLSKLLLFQQRVLQKISDIKQEIRNTSVDIDSDKQLQRIRNNLRAKPIPFDDQLFESNNKKKSFDSNHFYSLPLRQLKPLATRYSVKLKDLSRQNSIEKNSKSQKNEHINDKNIISRAVQNQNQQITE